MADADPVGSGQQTVIKGMAWLGAADHTGIQILYLKSISKVEQLNTGGNRKCTFYLNREGNKLIQTGDKSQKTRFLLRGTGDHFLTC